MPGDVLDEKGNIVGEHKGYMHYTIGKRRGFTVKGAHEPHFVKELNPKTNTVEHIIERGQVATATVNADGTLTNSTGGTLNN